MRVASAEGNIINCVTGNYETIFVWAACTANENIQESINPALMNSQALNIHLQRINNSKSHFPLCSCRFWWDQRNLLPRNRLRILFVAYSCLISEETWPRGRNPQMWYWKLNTFLAYRIKRVHAVCAHLYMLISWKGKCLRFRLARRLLIELRAKDVNYTSP